MFDLAAAISNKIKETSETPNTSIGKAILKNLNIKDNPKLNVDKNAKKVFVPPNLLSQKNNIISKIQSKIFKNTLKENLNTILGNVVSNGITSLIIFSLIFKFF